MFFGMLAKKGNVHIHCPTVTVPSLVVLTYIHKQVCITLLIHSQVNAGWEADADVGPMISREAKARCERLIQSGIDEGAEVWRGGEPMSGEDEGKIFH